MLTIPLFVLAAVLLQEDPSALPSPVIESIVIDPPMARLKHGDPEIAGLTDPHWTIDVSHPQGSTEDPVSMAIKAPNIDPDNPSDSLKNTDPSAAHELSASRETEGDESVDDRKSLAGIELADGGDRRPQAHEVTIREGDSLFLIFKRFGISDKELALITEHDSLKKRFKRIRPGQSIVLHIDDEARVQRMMYRTDPIHFLDIERNGEGFDFKEVEEVPDIVRASANGRIDSSFDAARLEAGLPPGATDQVEDILKWDMDFSRDLRPGDTFSLIYEKKMKDGKMIRGGFGPILAVEFINRGKAIRAVRYVDPQGFGGYFTPDGSGMQKAFLRSPVATARISSRFSHARRHPILHTIRPHKGVDYAAPRGTRVMAVGDGGVQFVGNKGNYGKTIILKHHSGYSTLYAHLSKYAKGIHTGARVSQGQLIGFIGSTGLSTGPHLHYEFRINGVHQDPLTIRLPSDAPVPKKYRKDFREKTDPILTQLDIVSRPSVASSN